MRILSSSRLSPLVKAGLPLAATGLIAAACSSGTSANGSAHSGSSSNVAAASASVSVRNGSQGTYLVDAAGRSLYLFASDQPSKSSCSATCLSAWPALDTSGKVHAGSGVEQSKLTTITTDGHEQVAYNGHPLYTFTGDRTAGQTTGQGLNSFGASWWLVTPAGGELTSAGHTGGSTGSSPSASQSSDGGYSYGG